MAQADNPRTARARASAVRATTADAPDPGGPAAVVVSTRAVAPPDRFEFWRSLFGAMDIQPLDAGAARDFQAGFTALVARTGVRLVGMTAGPNLAAPREGADEVMISLMEAGAAQVLGEDGDAVRPDGRLWLIDGARRPRVVSRGHRNIYLALPRAMAVQALGGGDRPLERRAATTLPDTGLSRILAAHMRTVRGHAGGLDTTAAAAALRSLQALTLGALGQMRATAPADQPEPGLALAARQLIDRSPGPGRLTAEGLAASLGCSRTRLFDAFQAEGLSLADCIRQARMARARALLVEPARTVDEVAWLCGYADASSFGKAFRRLFGQTPGQWRAAARARAAVAP